MRKIAMLLFPLLLVAHTATAGSSGGVVTNIDYSVRTDGYETKGVYDVAGKTLTLDVVIFQDDKVVGTQTMTTIDGMPASFFVNDVIAKGIDISAIFIPNLIDDSASIEVAAELTDRRLGSGGGFKKRERSVVRLDEAFVVKCQAGEHSYRLAVTPRLMKR